MKEKVTIVIESNNGAVSAGIYENDKPIKFDKLSKDEKLNLLELLSFAQVHLIKDFFKNMIDIPINTNNLN